MLRKYEINSQNRVVALRKFGDVNKGDIGGFVDGYHNLSQWGKCWIYDNARVYQNARVKGNAKIFDECHVYQDAVLSGNFKCFGRCIIYARAKCYGNAELSGNIRVLGQPLIGGKTRLITGPKGRIEVYDSPVLDGSFHYHADVGLAVICGSGEYDFIRYVDFDNKNGDMRVEEHEIPRF